MDITNQSLLIIHLTKHEKETKSFSRKGGCVIIRLMVLNRPDGREIK